LKLSFINKRESVLIALKKLNTLKNVSMLILFVENNNKTVLDSLTDGDKRRSLVKDANLENGNIRYLQLKYFFRI
jgi:hypothetical protein